MSKHHHHHHAGCVRPEPEKLLQDAVERSRESGLRRTKALENVLSILIHACQPLTLADIAEHKDLDTGAVLQYTDVVGGCTVPQVFINGDLERRVPHNVNASFNYVEGESLMMGIKGLAVSSGSACTSASPEPSYVLRALGRSDELAHSSLRMTIGRYTTEADIDYAIETIKLNVAKLRELSPLWDMHVAGIDIASIQWAEH